jgi:hypothetical protein
MRSEPRKQAAFRVESSSYTLDGVAPGRKPHYGDQTTCSPSTGHGPRHSAWEGFRTMYLYQELSLGGGRIALGLPRLLITRPPSRPKSRTRPQRERDRAEQNHRRRRRRSRQEEEEEEEEEDEQVQDVEAQEAEYLQRANQICVL